MKLLYAVLSMCVSFLWLDCNAAATDLSVSELRCEYRINPLGIDVARPRLSWIMESAERNQRQMGFRVLVASSKTILGQNKADLWDSGKVESAQSVHVVYDGIPLKSGMRCHWKIRVWDKDDRVSAWSRPAWWEMALLDAGDWAGTWINDGKANPERDEDFYKDDPAPLFRKEFSVDKSVSRARLYISGLGYYEAYLNGKRVGDHLLDPGWTDYSKRVLYSTYDVTEQIGAGKNCIGVMLGDGWYNPLPLRMWGWLNLREYLPVGRRRFIAQLNIEHADGSKQSVVSDTSWKVADGPVLRNNVYLGEVYDARKEVVGWNEVGLDDSGWRGVCVAEEPIGTLEAQPQPPIKRTATLRPVDVTEPEPGVYIFDMGQNFAGTVKMRVRGTAGSRVTLRYGELLNENGTLNVMTSVCGQIKGQRRIDGTEDDPAQEDVMANIGGAGSPAVAWQTDTYILKGLGEEVFIPRFTFHGFRYVEVTGFPGRPEKDVIEGLRLNSALEQVGSFVCSNRLFNRIHKMVIWTFLSNVFSVQSDCPAREKFGYGGDLVATSDAFLFNFDMAGFYGKVVRDFADAARKDGNLTDTAPSVGIQYCGVGWAMAHPQLQYQLYRYYGDRKVIDNQYAVSSRWLDLVKAETTDHIVRTGLGDHESLVAMPEGLMTTAFYYRSARLMAQLARIAGRDDDIPKYAGLAEQIKTAFINMFVKPGTGQVGSGTQACQSVGLFFDLLAANERQAAANILVEQILDEQNGHLSTGIFGTDYMLDSLSQAGHADVAYTVVNQKTFPGWGYMMEKGATTLWEHWAFSANTFSHNHPMFGSVDKWFYKWLAGIQPAAGAVGFDRIIIRPQVVGDLTWVNGSYKSVRGTIASEWRVENDTLYLNVTVPVNTTATIYVPARDIDGVSETGRMAAEADVKSVRMEGAAAVFEVGSGKYTFTSKEFKRR